MKMVQENLALTKESFRINLAEAQGIQVQEFQSDFPWGDSFKISCICILSNMIWSIYGHTSS